MARRCNRWVVKIITMLFLPFAVFAYTHDYFLLKRSVIAFMAVEALFAIFMIIYVIYGCTCGHHAHLSDIHKDNDLEGHKNEVNNARQQYLLKKKSSI